MLWGHYFLSGDFQSLGYPFANLVGRELAQGRLPLWDPWRATGYPFVGNPQAQVFYPPSLLLPLLLDGGKISYLGLQWVTLLHCLWAGLGAYFYCRALGLSPLACFMGGLGFTLCGSLWGNNAHKSTLETIAWVPWVFWGLQRLLSRPGLASACLCALVSALFFNAGWTPGVHIMAPFFLAYFLAGLARDSEGKGRARLAAWGALAGVFAAGLAMAQFLPSMELTALSSRVKPDYGWSTEASLWPGDLITLLMPLLRYHQSGFMFDEYFFYSGLPCLMLAGVAFLGPRRPRFAVFWLVASLVALFAAFGSHTPFYRLVWETLPGAKYLRIPGRYVIFCQMALVALAAMGAARLADADALKETRGFKALCRVYLALALVAGAALVALWLAGPGPKEAAGANRRLAGDLAWFLAFWLPGWGVLALVGRKRLAGGPAVLCLAGLLVLEMAVFPGRIMWGNQPVATRFPLSPIPKFFRETLPPGRAGFDGPVEKPHLNIPNAALVYQVAGTGINDTLDEARHHALCLTNDPRIYADLRGERFLVSGRPRFRLPQNKYRPFELRPDDFTDLHLAGIFPGPLQRLELISYLAYGGLVKQGEPLADLVLLQGGRELARLPIRAGVETAEWSWDKAGSRPRHGKTTVASSFPVKDESYQGHFYRAVWNFGSGLSADRLRLVRTGSQAFIRVEKILLNGRNLFSLGRRYKELGPNLFQNLYSVPRAFLVHQWRVCRPNEPALHATALIGDWRQMCVLEKTPHFPAARPKMGPPPTDRVQIAQNRPDKVVARVDAASQGILVLVDTWYPGWRVKVNGQRRPLLRADYAYRGVAMPPGRSLVEFEYKPLQVRRGMAFSLATLAVMALSLLGAGVLRRRRAKGKTPPPQRGEGRL